jgi:transposase
VSTSTLGGHVSTIPNQVVDGRRRRRSHSDEFKANAVAACMQPGVSMAAVAMAHGVNANLLRRWVKALEMRAGDPAVQKQAVPTLATTAAFVPLQVPTDAGAQGIRIELRRGATTISVTWPADAAAQCAGWMRELLR